MEVSCRSSTAVAPVGAETWIAAFGVAWRLLDARCDDMSLM
jgi:hypothetical protein